MMNVDNGLRAMRTRWMVYEDNRSSRRNYRSRAARSRSASSWRDLPGAGAPKTTVAATAVRPSIECIETRSTD